MGAVSPCCCSEDEVHTSKRFSPRRSADVVDPNDEGNPGLDVRQKSSSAHSAAFGRANVASPVLARPLPTPPEAEQKPKIPTVPAGQTEPTNVSSLLTGRTNQAVQGVLDAESLKNLEAIEGLWRESFDGSVVGKVFRGFVFWDHEAFGHEPTKLDVRRDPDGVRMELLGVQHSASVEDESGRPLSWQEVRLLYQASHGAAVMRLRWTDGEAWLKDPNGNASVPAHTA